MAWFIGLMSGTSLDGIDGVLAQDGSGSLQATAHRHRAFPPALRAELLALNGSGADELHRAALATNALVDEYAAVVAELLRDSDMAPAQITAIGAHGQTVRHRPRDTGAQGYTLQLMNGARLAELSGIDVVCDFRSRDVAAGGEGAPLVPAFHAARFGRPGHAIAVLNLGGIANLTLLDGQGSVLGFDSGPGNVLMDLWCLQQRGTAFDESGTWAASGRVDAALLDELRAEPYLQRLPPKSTGRDLFDEGWLQGRLAGVSAGGSAGRSITPADVMATLAEFTARSVSDALRRHLPHAEELVVCGGGACNTHLMSRLQTLLGPDVKVLSSEDAGIPPDQVEALAFAWLASAFLARVPANVPAVTGARGPRVLGALYPWA